MENLVECGSPKDWVEGKQLDLFKHSCAKVLYWDGMENLLISENSLMVNVTPRIHQEISHQNLLITYRMSHKTFTVADHSAVLLLPSVPHPTPSYILLQQFV